MRRAGWRPPAWVEALRPGLVDLREGRSGFAEVHRRVEPALRRWARYFLDKWPGQQLHDEDDLAQLLALALWRAVDGWDPARADLVARVYAEVGRAGEGAMKRALKWGGKGRPRAAVQCAWPTTPEGEPLDPVELGDRGGEPDQEEAAAARELVERLPRRSLAAFAARRLVAGWSVADIARDVAGGRAAQSFRIRGLKDAERRLERLGGAARG